MSRSQIILVLCCTALLGVLYYAVGHQPIKVKPATDLSSPILDISKLSSARLSELQPMMADSIRFMEERLKGRDKNINSTLKNLSDAWRSTGNSTIAALYSKMLAEKENTAGAWQQAGDQLQVAARLSSDSSLISPLLEQAIFSYEEALKITPGDADITVALASCILEKTDETMKGVQLLLGVLKQDSNHIKANFVLGKWGIFSGQFEKAIKRLKVVVSLEPENLEASFYLGQAFQGLGDAENAVKCFRRCVELSDNPGFKENIEKIIDNIRNSKRA